MKKILYIATLALAAFSVLSCKQDNPEQQAAASSISITKAESTIYPEGGSVAIEVETSESFTVTSDRTWCTTSVSGKTITATAEPNTTNESRYCRLTIKSTSKTLYFSIIQLGEVISGFEGLEDFSAPVEGRELTFDITSNVEVKVEADQDWIHPVYKDGKLVITIDKNDQPMTRTGVITYSAAGVSGTVNVMQYPELKKADTWVLTAGDPTFDYPDYKATGSLKAGDNDLYMLYMVPKSEIEGSVDDYIFDKLALDTRNEILEKMEQTPEAQFKDYLLTGSDPCIFNVTPGDYYLIAIGFGENTYVSGLYQYTLVTIDDIRPTYYKWLGKWNVPRGVTTDTDVWTVEENVVDKSFKVYGFGGFDADEYATGAFIAIVDFDTETEEMVFKVYENMEVTWTNSTRGTMNAMLSGNYTNVAGKTYYNSGVGIVICRAKLNADGTATLTGGQVTSGGAPATFHNIRWYGRYTTSTGSRSAVSWTDTETSIPVTISKSE